VFSKTSFDFETIQLLSERLDRPIELNRIVSDIEIFEHLEKPYLTARMLLIDDSNLYQAADIVGSERILITIKTADEGSRSISKTFFIDSVEKQQKIQNNATTIAFHLVEDIFYESSLQNVNRYYSGKPSDIIKKISNQYFQKTIDQDGDDTQFVELIVPNLHPIDAMQWIRSRACTNRGYPFYLYSTLVGDSLKFEDLGTMLTKTALNAGNTPNFTASSNRTQSTMNIHVARRAIENLEMESQENLLDVIRSGLISSDYEFVDTLTENTRSFSYDIEKDLYAKLKLDGILSDKQTEPAISFNEKIKDKSINQYKSTKSTYIGGSMAYRDVDADNDQPDPLKYVQWNNSYNETKSGAEYKLRVIKSSMDTMLKKNPLSINLNGIEFLYGEKHSTIGNNIEVTIPNTQVHRDADREDKKKSGKYLIYSVRHQFSKTVDKYQVTMNCMKIGNLKGNTQ
tara:strand:+ start:2202 stop:3569 length:1368 start_codon:yes stop_codon:yes gene_type:complete